MTKSCLAIILAGFAGAVAIGGPAMAANPNGDWMVADGTAVIRITHCGAAYCGNIAWTRRTGGVDDKNPDPAKRGQPILGTQILSQMRPAGPDRWDGSVYNPQNGNTYTAHMTLVGADTLHIEGCVLGGIFCGGETWKRVKPNEQVGRR